MCTDHLKEKRELIQEILKDRKVSDLPKINQVFNLSHFYFILLVFELSHQLVIFMLLVFFWKDFLFLL